MDVFKSISSNLYGNTYIVIAFYVMVGCMIQKKGLEKTISATFKSSIGILMMIIGGDVVTKSMVSLTFLLQRGIGVIGIIPQNESIASITQLKFGTTVGTIMVLGMGMNILLAKTTKFKYIFLTGHQIMYMSCLLTIILSYGNLNNGATVIIGGILLGSMMTIFPAILQPYTKIITGKDTLAIGHFSSLGFYLAAQFGKLFSSTHKKGEKKDKKINTMILDTTLATALSMVLLFVISAILAGKSYVEEITIGSYFIVFAVKQGLIFATGVYIILTGVRILLQEMIPAFKGIADKVVPEAIPALDCSVLFTYRQNILMIGFLGSMAGGIMGMYGTRIFRPEVIIPSTMIHFFSGSAAGIYGYSTGGKRGALLSSILFGFLINTIPLWGIPYLRNQGFYRMTFGEFDFVPVGFLLDKVMIIIKTFIN